jgi:hypothetical protein
MATTDLGDDGLPSPESPAVDFAQYRARRLRMRLLELLDTLIVAIERRDLQAVWAVLDDEDAVRWFTAGLREEALTIARLPAASLRAPLRIYRYHHELLQLGDEPLERTGDTPQLALDLDSADTGRPVLPFPDPTAPRKDRRRGGGDSRRSGSR